MAKCKLCYRPIPRTAETLIVERTNYRPMRDGSIAVATRDIRVCADCYAEIESAHIQGEKLACANCGGSGYAQETPGDLRECGECALPASPSAGEEG